MQRSPVQTRLKFSRDHILGKGGQAVVHLGLWEGSIVAVKRISTRSKNPEVTKELKLQNLDHRNIVKFFGSEKDNDFM
jgi:serine/threonine protein kinase